MSASGMTHMMRRRKHTFIQRTYRLEPFGWEEHAVGPKVILLRENIALPPLQDARSTLQSRHICVC